ncbi:MAG: cytochrome P450 [Steroidobacteraceae bacterium]
MTQETFAPSRTDYNPFSGGGTNEQHALYARIRAETPVFYSPALKWWIVSRYDDAMRVYKDPKRFPFAQPALADLKIPPAIADSAPEGYLEDPFRMVKDPQLHIRMRRLATQVFKPSTMEARERQFREVTDRVLDAFANDGRTDLVAHFAVPLPLLVFGQVFGIPETDNQRIKQWSDSYIRLSLTRMDDDSALDAWRQDVEYFRYTGRLVEERRAAPRENDLLSDLIAARDEDTPAFTNTELAKFVQLLIIAGNETTRHLLGTMTLRLLEHPEQLAAVRAEPALASAAVEEALRFSGPLPGALRLTTEEVQLGGVTIPKGQIVQILNSSANRDAAAFEHSSEFDIRRKDALKHMAFSMGMHTCLGAPLARVEARVALQQLLARLPGLRLASTASPQWLPSMMVGLSRLDVEWDVAEESQR